MLLCVWEVRTLELKDRIKQVRTDNRLSQTAFAKSLLVSRSAICKMESGENEPSDQTKELICRTFGVNKAWLEEDKGEPYGPQTRNQEIVEFANRIMSDEDESFRKRFVTALSEARPEFWDELEVFLSTIKKD